MNEIWAYIVGGVIAAIIVVLLVFGLPFAQIWAINTIFGTNIDYNLKTWLAMIILNSFFARFSPNLSKEKK